MASVTLKNLNKIYPNGFVSVKDLSLHIADGEFVTFYGPSGCGKSTVLRMIGGLEDITSGEIYLGDDLLNDILPRDRHLAMAFQNYTLYNNFNVYDNMALGLKLRNMPRNIIDTRVKQAADFFGISHVLHKKSVPSATRKSKKPRLDGRSYFTRKYCSLMKISHINRKNCAKKCCAMSKRSTVNLDLRSSMLPINTTKRSHSEQRSSS